MTWEYSFQSSSDLEHRAGIFPVKRNIVGCQKFKGNREMPSIITRLQLGQLVSAG
jgi:hypothetical protein